MATNFGKQFILACRYAKPILIGSERYEVLVLMSSLSYSYMHMLTLPMARYQQSNVIDAQQHRQITQEVAGSCTHLL